MAAEERAEKNRISRSFISLGRKKKTFEYDLL